MILVEVPCGDVLPLFENGSVYNTVKMSTCYKQLPFHGMTVSPVFTLRCDVCLVGKASGPANEPDPVIAALTDTAFMLQHQRCERKAAS